jgi:hypothetical protein
MTAQSPERIIIDGRPRALYADPIGDLLESRGVRFKDHVKVLTTACWRCYRGTWEIRDGALYLVHFSLMQSRETPLTRAARERLFQATDATSFPMKAVWFTGVLRVAIGKRLIYSHHGWSSWFERERVLHIRAGDVVRDREVDTRAILERHLKRNPRAKAVLEGESRGPVEPLIWFDKRDTDWTADWWPPGYKRKKQRALTPDS